MPINRKETTRTFVLYRDEDATGISRNGIVAEGVEFRTSESLSGGVSASRSTVIWDSIDDVHAIHGHEGKTRVIFDPIPVYHDETPSVKSTTPYSKVGVPDYRVREIMDAIDRADIRFMERLWGRWCENLQFRDGQQ